MKKYIYGVDLGGTTIKIGLFTYDGILTDSFQIKTNTNDDGKFILSDIASAIGQHMDDNNITNDFIHGVGIGVPGPVSNGIVNHCVNLGWKVVNVKEKLESLIHLPVAVSNDANIAGLGELWKGGGSGYSDLIFITLGTGVGGAVIVNSQVVDGHVGAGGEIGHAPTRNGHYKCNCGKIGCLETVASATGVVRVCQELLKNKNAKSSLREIDDISAKIIFDQAKEKDPIALETIEIFGDNLGFTCATLGITTNPQAFVFGGGVSNAGTIITDVVKKYFDQYAFFPIRENTDFNLAKLGNEAGIYGAAYLAKQL